jgi:hypothetical protein
MNPAAIVGLLQGAAALFYFCSGDVPRGLIFAGCATASIATGYCR